jgi:hypothetical protein
MAKNTNVDVLPEGVHARALFRFDKCYLPVQDERWQALEDRRFVTIAGAMWEGGLRDQFDQKPRPEINKINMGIKRIMGEYAQNRIQVEFRSKAVHYDKDESGELLASLLRADERQCNAQEAYDNCFEEGVAGGMGALRVRVVEDDEYDEDNDNLRVVIEPVVDADQTVFFDIDSKRYDKVDAKYAFLIWPMSRSAYTEKFDRTPASFNKVNRWQTTFDWIRPDIVYVAEYYEISEKTVTNHKYKNEITGEERKFDAGELAPDEIEGMLAVGWKKESSRKVKRRVCKKWLIDGAEVLEGGDDGIEIAGGMIPVIPFYGQRRFVDNIERVSGYVRTTKDIQRLYNMQLSLLTEIASLSPIEKPIIPVEMVKGWEQIWAMDNINRYPYLPINPLKDANQQIVATGPTAYTKAPDLSPGLQAIIQLADSDIKELTGSQEQAEKVRANVSAEAISLIQNQAGLYTYTYLDNFSKTMRRFGEVYAAIAKETYGYTHVRQIVNEQGEEEVIELQTEGVNLETGLPELQNDISRKKWDVIVDVGPSTTSKRDQTVKNCIQILQALGPQSPFSNLIASVMLENMEGEGFEHVREFVHKQMLQQNMIEPITEDDKKYMQEWQQQQANQPPDPQAQLLQAAAAEKQALAQKAQMSVHTELASAQEKQARAQLLHSQIGDSVTLAQERQIKMVMDAHNVERDHELRQTETALRGIDLQQKGVQLAHNIKNGVQPKTR